MKRFATLLLTAVLLLTGCSFFSESQQPVLFYYQQAEYQLGKSDGAIAVEERDGTGHITDTDYLLRLYMAGPHSEELISPFPEDVQLTNIRTGKNVITLTLSGSPDALSDSEKILACSCLTLTCLEITDSDSIMICWGEDIITMNRSSMTLFDESAPIPD